MDIQDVYWTSKRRILLKSIGEKYKNLNKY